MRLTLDRPGGPVIDVDEGQLLGEGGEGRVFALGQDRVVKLYHPGVAATPGRARKLRALLAKRATLPAAGVVVPDGLVVDATGGVIGLTMPRVRQGLELFSLAQRRPAGVDAMTLLASFRGLLATVTALHTAGVVVGDLNDGNVLIDDDGRGTAWLIDVDSVQVDGLPCPVAHERSLDPRLYGVDLTAKPAFSPSTDHYALRVLLFQLLCGVHPYGGVHATLPTLVRRAEARHSVLRGVLRGDVKLPKVARSLLALPDALRADFARCFDDDVRVVLDDALLALRWVRCGCGLEHGQRVCPTCAVVVAVPARRVGGVVDLDVVVRGDAVMAACFDGALRFVVQRGDRLERESGDVVLVGAPPPGLQVQLDGARTWLALPEGSGAVLLALQGGVVVERTSTGLVLGRPAWCVSPAGLFRLDGDSIVHHGSGTRVGRAIVGATHLFPVDDGCLAVWRAGRVFHASWCRPGHGPNDLVLPAVDGRIRTIDVTSDGDRAVLALTLEHGGRDHHRVVVVERTRGVVAVVEHDGRDDALAWVQPARPRLLRGRRLLHVDDRGLAMAVIDDAASAPSITSQLRFDDADLDDVVKDVITLLPGPGDDLFVVSPTAITRCRRRAPTTSTTTTTPQK